MSNTPNLNALGDSVSVTLPNDADDYLDRECPVEGCQGHFKVKPGTGLRDVDHCGCPYCGHRGPNDTFHHPAQIEYAQSVTARMVTEAVGEDFRKALRGTGSGLLKFSVETKKPASAVYPHMPLPTKLLCAECGLDYKLAAERGICPDCGAENGGA